MPKDIVSVAKKVEKSTIYVEDGYHIAVIA